MHFKAPQPSRSAGVMRLERKACHDEPLDVCGAWLQLETRSRLHQRVDWSATRYGKHPLCLGSSGSWPSRCWGLLSESQRGPPHVMGSRGILYRPRVSIPWRDSGIPSCVISPHAFFVVNHALVCGDVLRRSPVEGCDACDSCGIMAGRLSLRRGDGLVLSGAPSCLPRLGCSLWSAVGW
jgi:hypothetical protein